MTRPINYIDPTGHMRERTTGGNGGRRQKQKATDPELDGCVPYVPNGVTFAFLIEYDKYSSKYEEYQSAKNTYDYNNFQIAERESEIFDHQNRLKATPKKGMPSYQEFGIVTVDLLYAYAFGFMNPDANAYLIVDFSDMAIDPARQQIRNAINGLQQQVNGLAFESYMYDYEGEVKRLEKQLNNVAKYLEQKYPGERELYESTIFPESVPTWNPLN